MNFDFNRILFVNSYICNMHCPYCMHAWHKEHLKRFPNAQFGLENSKKLFDFLLENTKSKTVQITFSGGEPLVFYEQYVKPFTLYMRQREKETGIKVVIDMFTNGTLLTADMFQFFKNQKLQIGFSYDGHCGQEYRDLKTREKVENNIQLGLSIMPELISCASTFYKDSFAEMLDAYKSVSNMGVRQWGFAIDTLTTTTTYSLEDCQLVGDQIKAIYEESKTNPCNVMTFEKIQKFHRYIETNKAIIARPDGEICIGTTVPILIPEEYFKYFSIGFWEIDPKKLQAYQDIMGEFHIHIMGKNYPYFCQNCLVKQDCQNVTITKAEQEIRQEANPMHCLEYWMVSSILRGAWD